MKELAPFKNAVAELTQITALGSPLVSDPRGQAWMALPKEVRVDVQRWQSALAKLPRGLKTTGKPSLFEWLAGQLGVSVATARRKYYLYKKTPTWEALVDGRKSKDSLGDKGMELSGARHPAFIQWALKIFDSHQRSYTQAIAEIQSRILAGGESVPGLEEHNSRLRLPEGCSKPSLYRLLQKHTTQLERTATQWGERAALSQCAPYVRTTRVGLSVGSQYMFDDVWHDNYVTYEGKPVRVLEFGAHDVFSGARFSFGQLPRVKEGDKYRGLRRENFQAFLAHVLSHYGYRADGVLLMMEHGTATLTSELITDLYDKTGGIIKVGMGGIGGAGNKLISGWSGRAAGNPRYKSMIECVHSLVHNILGFLPGQTGHDRRQPETTDGMIAYQETLAKLQSKLGLKADYFASPLIPHDIFYKICLDLYEVLNARTDHKLEGWRECGHIINEYRLGAGDCENIWTPEIALTNPDSDKGDQTLALVALRHLITSDPSRHRERRLSPLEVWESGRRDLVKLPLDLYAQLVGEAGHRDKKVSRGYVTIVDKDISPEPLIYSAKLYLLDGGAKEIPHGDTVATLLNPYNRGELIVLGKRGGILGKMYLDTAVSRAESDGVTKVQGKIAARRTVALSALTHRRQDQVRDVATLKEHNHSLAQKARGALPTPAKTKSPKTSPRALSPSSLMDLSEFI